MKSIAFDFETIADKSIISLLPEIEPDSRLKDPVKIAQNIKNKEVKRVQELGLNPATSLICCFGWHDGEKSGHIMLADEENEKALIEATWEKLSEYDHFISFNGINFDIPTLKMHSLKNRVRPAVNISTKRYDTKGNHADVRMILANWDNFQSGKLDFYAKMLLGSQGKDDMSGDQVQDYWDMEMYDEIGSYCEEDCRMTWDIWTLVQKYYLL